MMKFKPDISILPGFLFVLDIDYPHVASAEEFICLADVNDGADLSAVFDLIVRPEFLSYSESDKCWLIETIAFFMDEGNSFEDVFAKRSLLFSEEIEDGRMFMRTLLERLRTYL
ncbi:MULTISPECIES: hypothetical protein [unclassified Pseudomonas]|uniref:hypothetical protein n=1 Tax=unclassified Pseudomonas TaxID=196821 RepID=UPI00215C84B3|nr:MULTISPECIES: hypothetical protein [unclassified Pseudomonas]MCR8932214.1 hypothetical protein [Pseudomonas sp. S11A4]MCR8975824.1 hypothetical protein [Pseudomonas sp. S11P7]